MSTEPRPKTLQYNGSKVHYWSFNDDQPHTLVMVHGFRGTHHGLQKIIDRLPEFRIVIPDLPGFGASTPMTEHTHDVEGYADFIADLISELGLYKPTLVGHSFGSVIAAAVAANQPKIIDKLVLINPIATPTSDDPRWPIMKMSEFFYWLGGMLPTSTGRALLSNRFIVLAVSAAMVKTKKKILRSEIHKHHLKYFSTFQDPMLLHKIFLVSSSTSVQQYAEQIKAKTLLIVGAVDNVAPLANQNALRRKFKHAELYVLPNVGHLVHHEAPVRAARAIRSFLSET